jgi:hypothetical protein
MSIREQAAALLSDPLLTPADCAKEAAWSDRFIRAEIYKGRLKAIKVSHKMVRIRRSWWNEYLAERQTSGVAA